jgi:hypothetical protein
LGIGDWAQSPIPNPQSPIPNPHFMLDFFEIFEKKINLIKFRNFKNVNKIIKI